MVTRPCGSARATGPHLTNTLAFHNERAQAVVMDAESTYLDLYDVLVDEAEYLQSDEELGRNLLVESIIVGALSAMLVAFCNGFFGRLGEKAADDVAAKTKGLFERGAEKGEQKATLEGLDLLTPYLRLLNQSTDAQTEEEVLWIADYLEGRGFPRSAAKRMAGDTLTILRAAGTPR